MKLKTLEILFVVFYWLVLTPTTIIVLRDPELIPWETCQVWLCAKLAFGFALIMAIVFWIILMLLILIYIKVKACCRKTDVTTATSSTVYVDRSGYVCPQLLLSQSFHKMPEDETSPRLPTRPAPCLPRKIYQNKDETTPPAYEEICP